MSICLLVVRNQRTSDEDIGGMEDELRETEDRAIRKVLKTVQRMMKAYLITQIREKSMA